MNQGNYVMFKGTKEGINILLKEGLPFTELKTLFAKKVEESAKFFDGVKTSIAFKGRELSDEEEAQLLKIITEKTTMTITFIRDGQEQTPALPNGLLLPEDIAQFHITKYHKGSIRSGQCLTFDGSVVVIGDVNPGGEVKAEGNIIILGQLKGMAHAGYKGMTDAFVCAVYMIPVQLRIADIITRFPEENKKGQKPPEFAYIENGQIYVMPLA